jgi:hypothetical protein
VVAAPQLNQLLTCYTMNRLRDTIHVKITRSSKLLGQWQSNAAKNRIIYSISITFPSSLDKLTERIAKLVNDLEVNKDTTCNAHVPFNTYT